MGLLRSDLPLGRDAAGRFLPWIVALTVYLAALAVAGAMAAGGLAERWRAGLAGSMTVQLPPAFDLGAPDERLERVLAVITATPGIAGAEVLDGEQMRRLIEPWIGPATGADLPMPQLIAVTLLPDAAVDGEELGRRLAAAAPGATLDDHRAWLDSVERMARSVRLAASGILVLVLLAAVASVVFVARIGLAIHRRVIDVMHLVGAQDSYIASQFQAQALRLGLIGGVIGVALAALTLVGGEHLRQRLDALIVPAPALSPGQWAALVLLPPAAAVVAMVTARVTVMRELKRML